MEVSLKDLRPSRLLNSKKTTAAMRPTIDKNATESPLLRLPPEVRNRIYSFVLGGQTLHMRFAPATALDSPARVTHAICVAYFDDETEADNIRENQLEDGGFNYPQRHDDARCVLDNTYYSSCKRMSLAILRSCRLIHSEAALLPYLLNMFSFVQGNVLETFVDGCNPTQLRAIRSITLGKPDGLMLNRPSVISKLSGLVSIAIFGLYEGIPRQRKEWVDDRIAVDVLRRLEELPIRRAKVCITLQHDLWLSNAEPREDALARVRLWGADLQRRLLQPQHREGETAKTRSRPTIKIKTNLRNVA